MTNIKRDKRQENFITIITGRLKNRVCPSGWDMRHASHEEYARMLKDIYEALLEKMETVEN